MKRRDFLKKLAKAGFVVSATGALPLLDLSKAEAETTPYPLAVAAEGSPAELTREALRKLGGMGAFVKDGDSVVVKPNIGWDRTPEEGANTHPEVVRELVMMALDAGAAEVRVFDRTCNDPRRCYKRSGIEDAIDSIDDSRAKITHVDELRYEVVEIRDGISLTKWPLYRPALEADVLINAPVVKHHGMSEITIGMKNLMGVMGGNRGRLHRDLTDGLVDLSLAVKSHLTVVDATRVLLAGGPQGGGTGNVKKVGKVGASRDVVTADAWGATMFGVDPFSIPHIKRAHERGLGIADLSKVKIL
ncbi:MAG: cytoplasmic protein [Deltaproteobacteria bacterium]|nr:MAG: cytoplasmic protein [Deltaproteobacteria bacterium]